MAITAVFWKPHEIDIGNEVWPSPLLEKRAMGKFILDDMCHGLSSWKNCTLC